MRQLVASSSFLPCFFTNLLLSTFYLVLRLHSPLEIHRLFWRLPHMEVVAIVATITEASLVRASYDAHDRGADIRLHMSTSSSLTTFALVMLAGGYHAPTLLLTAGSCLLTPLFILATNLI